MVERRTATAEIDRPQGQRALSAAKRKTYATEQIQKHLAASSASDKATAITAALEMIADRLYDPAIQGTLRQKYEELRALSTTKPKGSTSRPPKPAGSGSARAATLEQLNPYHILEDVGPGNLRARLDGNTQRRLRTAVDMVQERNPDIKPRNRSRNQDMIDYIVEMLAGPGY